MSSPPPLPPPPATTQALGFKLHATPLQVAFHFKRLMKGLERNPLDYLGLRRYEQWQQTLQEETSRAEKREVRQKVMRQHSGNIAYMMSAEKRFAAIPK